MRSYLVPEVAVLLAATAGHIAASNPVRKVTVYGGRVAGTMEITDPATLALSDVISGTFLDTARGAARVPERLPQYVVSFYLPDDHEKLWRRVFGPRKLQRAYVVRLVLDTTTGTGYVYIPGDSDAWAPWNRGTSLALTAIGPLAVAFFPSASDAAAVQLRAYVRDGVEITALRTPTLGDHDWTFAESDPRDFVVRGRWLFATFGQTDLRWAIGGLPFARELRHPP